MDSVKPKLRSFGGQACRPYSSFTPYLATPINDNYYEKYRAAS
ncbi:MAG: hypothetical protein WBZ19_07805 [Chthoniobacterales bacterium]